MERINFKDGQLVKEGYVEIDGVQHQIHEAEYSGDTPLSAHVMNKLQDNIERELITTKTTEISESLTITDSAPVNGKLNINGGKSVQATRSGKNFLELIDGTYKVDDLTLIVKNGMMTANGKVNSTPTILDIPLKKQIIIPANTTYTLRGFNTKTIGDKTDYVSLRLGAIGSGNDNRYNNAYLHNVNCQATISSSTEYTLDKLILRMNSNVTLNDFICYPQLELGSGTDIFEQGGVSPSPDYPSEVKSCGDNIQSGQGGINIITCNKNFFKSPLIGYSIFGSGSEGYKVDKVSNGVTYIAKLINNQNYYIKKNNNIGDRFRIVLFKDYPVSTTYSKDSIQIINDSNLYEYGFNSDKYNYVAFTINASSIYIGDCLAQLELGSISTSYQEHQSQLITVPTQKPFRSIGDYKDIFVNIDGKWYEKHYIARKIFDGTENWSKSPYGTNNYILSDFGICDEKGAEIKAISNYFLGVPFDNRSSSGKNIIYIINTYGELNIRETSFATVDEWKAYLAEQYANGTPVYVDYALKEPELIECTENQKEALYQLEHLPMYENITYITCIDEIKPDMQATYLYNNDLNKCYGAKDDELEKEISKLINKMGNWGNTEALEDYKGDLNDIVQTGFIMANSDTANTPYSSGWYILTFVKNPDYYILQIAFSRNDSNVFYTRIKCNEIWSDWSPKIENYINFEIFSASDSIKSFILKGLEIGGIYSIAFSYNFNTTGNKSYRSTVYAILSIPCGYNWSTSKVIVRPKLQIITNYSGTGIEADSNLQVVCEGGITEIEADSFENAPQLYLYFTNGKNLDNFNVKIKKIN